MSIMYWIFGHKHDLEWLKDTIIITNLHTSNKIGQPETTFVVDRCIRCGVLFTHKTRKWIKNER